MLLQLGKSKFKRILVAEMKVHVKRGLHSVGILGLRLPLVTSDVVAHVSLNKLFKMKINNITFASFLFFVIFAFNSCSQGSSYGGQANPIPNNGIIVDSSVFFKVTFSGKTLCVYPIYKDGNQIDLTSAICQVTTYTNNNNQTESKLWLDYGPNSESILRDYYNFNIPWKTCQIIIQTHKLGDNLGSYNINAFGYIYDFSIGGNTYKEYKIEAPIFGGANSSYFTITSIDSRFVTGIFTCILIDGTNRIPASGSFRLPS